MVLSVPALARNKAEGDKSGAQTWWLAMCPNFLAN
jgi:hypothetical protein